MIGARARRCRRPSGAALIVALVVDVASRAQSQAPGPTEPVMVAHVEIVWSRPTVVADAYGRVHVLWGGATPDAPDLPDGADQKPDAIYHSMWDGRSWSEPRPVLLKPRGAWTMLRPAAAVAGDQLSLTWSGGTGLYFSRAPVLEAHRAEAWEAPRHLADGDAADVALHAGPGAALTAIYTRMGSEKAPAGNVYFLRSDDGGATWPAPVQVSDLDASERAVAPEPSLARDGAGSLHAVWAVRTPPNWLGGQIRYARSTDQGRTWVAPESLAVVDDVEPWVDSPNIVATADGMLHLLYACGKPPHRCYRASADGGTTWSAVERPFGALVSLAGWDALIGDDESGLHLFTQQRYPMGMYYAWKPAGQPWRTPQRLVGDAALEDGHFPRLALSGGNRLHAVWQRLAGRGDVMYLRIDTAAAARDPASPPEGVAAVPTLTPRRAGSAPASGAMRRPLVLGGAVAVLVAAGALWRRRRH